MTTVSKSTELQSIYTPPTQSAEMQCIVLEALDIVQNEMMVSLEKKNERIKQHIQGLPDNRVPFLR